MATRRKSGTPQDAGKTRNARAAEIAATLPKDRAGLLACALEAVGALHAAVLTVDDKAAAAAADRYEAVIWKLNGRTFFGAHSVVNPDAAGHLVEQHCRAQPGAVPLWGQRGEFLITVSGVRAVAELRDGFGRFRVGFAFHAVDADKPFISETGYKSHFEAYGGGRTVEQVAIGVFSTYLAGGRCMLEAKYRERLAVELCWPWLAPAPAMAAELAYEERGGQLAFSF
jgi:hypothetical protein